jgi:hypothetical protein
LAQLYCQQPQFAIVQGRKIARAGEAVKIKSGSHFYHEKIKEK